MEPSMCGLLVVGLGNLLLELLSGFCSGLDHLNIVTHGPANGCHARFDRLYHILDVFVKVVNLLLVSQRFKKYLDVSELKVGLDVLSVLCQERVTLQHVYSVEGSMVNVISQYIRKPIEFHAVRTKTENLEKAMPVNHSVHQPDKGRGILKVEACIGHDTVLIDAAGLQSLGLLPHLVVITIKALNLAVNIPERGLDELQLCDGLRGRAQPMGWDIYLLGLLLGGTPRLASLATTPSIPCRW